MAVSLRRVAPWLLGALSTALAPAAVSAQTEVNAFEPSFTENGVWFENVLASGATAEIVDLTGEGGDLENNQPLPTGAARLTTDFDNDDQADVAVRDDYGLAGEVLPSLTLEYSWHKASNSGQNLFAAPAIRLAIYAEDCSVSDCFGTFIYEPYWQPDGSVHTPPLDQG